MSSKWLSESINVEKPRRFYFVWKYGFMCSMLTANKKTIGNQNTRDYDQSRGMNIIISYISLFTLRETYYNSNVL